MPSKSTRRKFPPKRYTQRKQCKSCPWLRCNDPREIPNGMESNANELLDRWTANEQVPLHRNQPGMSCHCTPIGPAALPCVGWAVYELTNNNLGLRMQALTDDRLRGLYVIGPQRTLAELRTYTPDYED